MLPFEPTHGGVFATAARLQWIPFVFRRAIGDGWETAYADFVTRGGMPPDGETPLTQEEFDIVAEWFIRGVPMVDEVLPADPAPTDCMPGVSSDVATHVTAMSTMGWASRNADEGLLMHGCAGAATTLDCLSTERLVSGTGVGAAWDVVEGSRARLLYTTSYRSSYWTRSSADGRFVGQGGGSPAGSTIIDLSTDRTIGVRASYDPGFFPDNSGFMFLGGGGGICEQSVLTTGTPTTITFSEPQCNSAAMVGLYEHVGASLAGGDYWAVHGQFVSDNGGHSATHYDPAADFGPDSRARLTRMTNSAAGFMAQETLSVATPYEGDAVISPSSRLLISRVAGAGSRQLGFVMRRIDATNEGGTWRVELPEVARYCMTGGKPAFSYDERWMVLHHYIGTDADAIELGFASATDPGFAAYRSQGAANLYLVDLATGASTRITNMSAGQYALFPHFRSDGWIYFVVRSPGTGTEHVVASDAALVLASR